MCFENPSRMNINGLQPSSGLSVSLSLFHQLPHTYKKREAATFGGQPLHTFYVKIKTIRVP